MARDKQHNLNQGLDLCELRNGLIHLCDYHKNRCNSTIFSIEDNVLANCGNNQAELLRTEDIVELSELFSYKEEPAGGWYLVKEQREWLKERLVEEFNNSHKKRIKILEAGVASFIHHYTFLTIIIEAANVCSFPLTDIYVDVVDKCYYPILQIAYMENFVRKRNKVPNQIEIYDNKIKLKKSKIKFIKTNLKYFNQINTRLFIRDLRDFETISEIGSFNIITEHFLTSVLKQNTLDIIKVRKSYEKLLERKGSLLCATGIIDKVHFSEFTKLNKDRKLIIDDDSLEKVWDPYGLKQDEFDMILANEKYSPTVYLDNYLIKFIKENE